MSEHHRRRTPNESAEADVRLLLAARDGDEDARRRVAERYDPLVRRVAQRFHAPGATDDLDDLIQVGHLGLLEALSRFDPERGSFAAYASVTVSGTIKRHFRDRGWKLKIPRSLHDATLAISRGTVELEGRLGRRPTDSELVEHCELELAEVVEARRLMQTAQPLSLQASTDEGEGMPSLGDSIGEEDPNFSRVELRQQIGALTEPLDPADRELLALRFGLERTQVEIAELLGCSQMQVSRLLRRALTAIDERIEGEPAEA
jgi:RNA polymerase sigma-B factor